MHIHKHVRAHSIFTQTHVYPSSSGGAGHLRASSSKRARDAEQPMGAPLLPGALHALYQLAEIQFPLVMFCFVVTCVLRFLSYMYVYSPKWELYSSLRVHGVSVGMCTFMHLYVHVYICRHLHLHVCVFFES